MPLRIPHISGLVTSAGRVASLHSIHAHQQVRTFTESARMAAIVDSHFISQITNAERRITKIDEPAKGGPTAQAQSHAGQPLNAQVVRDIALGEQRITGKDSPVRRGPASISQSILSFYSSAAGTEQHTGHLDSHTLRKITEKEKEITGETGPVQKGPTAKAQQHTGEPITSEALRDITEGEKKITHGARVKGGPTSAAQSELSKSFT